jgi:hypothetical protein
MGEVYTYKIHTLGNHISDQFCLITYRTALLIRFLSLANVGSNVGILFLGLKLMPSIILKTSLRNNSNTGTI